MKRLPALLGALFLAAAGVWQLWLGPHWTQRLPPGWRWEANYLGISAYADWETGEFEDTGMSIYRREVAIEEGKRQPGGAVWVTDHYITYDTSGETVTWEFLLRAQVDPSTGRHTAPEFAGDYFVFPRQVQQQTYSMRFTSYPGLPLEFQGQEEIEGLTVYRFGYHGYGENTASYASTDDFQGVDVEPGQDIRCLDDQLDIVIWVEPVTGETVKMAESCLTGDHVYETATNTPLYPVSRWGGETAGDDLYRQASLVRADRTRYLWAAYYAPAALLAGGLLALAAGLIAARR